MSDSVPQNQKSENHILRWFTVILILFVVYIHYNPQVPFAGCNLPDVVVSVGRFAMPVFFMISGYYLFSKDGHSENKLMGKAKHIFYLILFIKFFYLALDLVFLAFGVIDGSHILFDFLVFGDTTAHYWFVAALLTAYLGHWFFHRYHIDFKWLIPIGVALLAVDMIVGELLPACGVGEIFGARVGDIEAATYVSICLFFFQMGYYIHKHEDWIKEKFPTWKLLVIAALSMALNVLEMIAIFDTHIYDGTAAAGPNVYVGTIFFSFAFFVLTFRVKFEIKPLEWIGRNASAWLYAFVGLGIALVKLVLFVGRENETFLYNVIGPFLAMAINIVAAVLMYFILKRLFSKKGKPKADSDSGALDQVGKGNPRDVV